MSVEINDFPGACFVHDVESRSLRAVNEQFRKEFGCSKPGVTTEREFGTDDAVQMLIETARRDTSAQPKLLLQCDGPPVRVRARPQLVERDGTELLVTQVERTESITHHARTLRELYAIISSDELAFDTMLEGLLEVGCERLDKRRRYVARLEDGRLSVIASYDTETGLETDGATLPAELDEATVTETADVFTLRPDEEDVRTLVGVSVHLSEFTGVVCFADTSDAAGTVEMTESERAFLGVFAQFVAQQWNQRIYEQQLQQRERRLRQIVDLLPQMVFAKDEDGTYVLANETTAEKYGVTVDELEGAKETEIAPSEEQAEVFHREDLDVIESGEPKVIPKDEFTDADGNEHVLRTRKIPYDPIDSEKSAVLGVNTFVTERVERERQLRELQEGTETLMRVTSAEEIRDVVQDIARDVLPMSVAGVAFVDGDAESLGLRSVGADERAGSEDDTQQLINLDVERVDVLAVGDADGEPPLGIDGEGSESAVSLDDDVDSLLLTSLGEYGTLVVATSDVPDLDEADESLLRLFVSTVVTAFERVEREQQLKRREEELVQKNDRLEKFASVVSHDLRNPLMVANARLDIASQERPGDHVETARDALDRMERLIDDLLAYARHGVADLDLGRVTLEALASDAQGMVELEPDELVVESTVDFRADPGRVQQLFENLFRNAVERGSAGNQTQSDDPVEHDSADVTVRVGALDGGFYVEDDGPGIPEGKRQQVLEAGYTTSDDGTGFGLNIVEEIADAHGWKLTVTDGADGGARFEFRDVELLDEPSSAQ